MLRIVALVLLGAHLALAQENHPLYLAIPKTLTERQAQLAVAGVAAANNNSITAVEISEDSSVSTNVIIAEQNPCCNQAPARPPAPTSDYEAIAPILSIGGSDGPNKFFAGFGVKLAEGTLLVLGEAGVGTANFKREPYNLDNDVHGGVGFSSKLDPFSFTHFPVRPTGGYRYFKLFVGDGIDVISEGFTAGIVARIAKIDNQTFEIFADGTNARVTNRIGIQKFYERKRFYIFGGTYKF